MLIVAASMGAELASLQREVEQTRPYHASHHPGGQQAVEFRLLGVGPERAGASMAEILAQPGQNRTGNNGAANPGLNPGPGLDNVANGANGPVDGVLLLGIAGAAAPELETGNLLLPASYAWGAAPTAQLKPDAAMLQQAEQAAARLAMPVNRGASVTVDHLVREVEERQSLREKHGADSINMEDYRVAEAAAGAGVPFLAVRVVLDTAAQRMPAYLEGLSKSRYGMITKILGMPWRIPTLWRLKEQLLLCQAVIARFGAAYLALEDQRWESAKAQAAARALY